MTRSGPPDPAAGPPARELPPDAVTIRCREHGPLVVEMPSGDDFQGLRLRVTDHEGREFILPAVKKAVALCRCGQSDTRPFCDGSHKTCGFQAGERAAGP
ncbi:MAG: CDGSH iron-sulfur domain-containing protein [Planctomycetia bacterium]